MNRTTEATYIRNLIQRMEKMSKEQIYDSLESHLPISIITIGSWDVYIEVIGYDRRICMADLYSTICENQTFYLFANNSTIYAFDLTDNARLTIWTSRHRSCALVEYLRDVRYMMNYLWFCHKKDLLPSYIIQRQRMKKRGIYPVMKKY